MTCLAWISGFGRTFDSLLRSRRAATIAEYGIAAGLAVVAWGAVDSPRFQPAKDFRTQIECVSHLKRGNAPRWDRSALDQAPRRCTVKAKSA